MIFTNSRALIQKMTSTTASTPRAAVFEAKLPVKGTRFVMGTIHPQIAHLGGSVIRPVLMCSAFFAALSIQGTTKAHAAI